MDHQLRTYTIAPGRLDDFLALWRDHLVAAREANAFAVVGAWVNREENTFTWIVRHDGEGGFEAGDARYYASPERAASPWDPRDVITGVTLHMAEAVHR